jgi:hypothetical protein
VYDPVPHGIDIRRVTDDAGCRVSQEPTYFLQTGGVIGHVEREPDFFFLIAQVYFMRDDRIFQPDPFYQSTANRPFGGHAKQLVLDGATPGIDNE